MAEAAPFIRSAKRTSRSTRGRDSWYGYYAGFTTSFVLDVLAHFGDSDHKVCLDPWNGSGTTTQAAHEWGCVAVGLDINPVMTIVAKSRLIPVSDKSEIVPLIDAIDVPVSFGKTDGKVDDPLSTWFAPATAAEIRRIAKLFFADVKVANIAEAAAAADGMTCRTALCFVALFRMVRRHLRPFVASNPTWIKSPHDAARVSIEPADIRKSLREELGMILSTFDPHHACRLEDNANSQIRTASSTALPLPDASVDVIVTSPPYCTRIDYATTTLPELAVLGVMPSIVRNGMRRQMLGTPTVPKKAPVLNELWGETANKVLAAIHGHSSKAAATYYFKNVAQYFDGLCRSIAELSRVSRPAARSAIVVQDSYFKEVHIDLAPIVAEMSAAQGFRVDDARPLSVGRSLGAINSRSRAYRSIQRPATEVMVTLTRDQN